MYIYMYMRPSHAAGTSPSREPPGSNEFECFPLTLRLGYTYNTTISIFQNFTVTHTCTSNLLCSGEFCPSEVRLGLTLTSCTGFNIISAA